MERTGILALMGDLKLYGMRAACGEVMTAGARQAPVPAQKRRCRSIAGIKHQHEPPRIAGDLLKAEIAGKQARPVKGPR